jgi:Adenylate and Guanylate cyclase catalytic domain
VTIKLVSSRANTDCIESAPVRTYEREVGILFADIRGFTPWSEKRSPAEVPAALTRFYALASRVLTRDDAFVEFVGDQVMALYLPDFPSLVVSDAIYAKVASDGAQAEPVSLSLKGKAAPVRAYVIGAHRGA